MKADGGESTHDDERVAAVETVRINWSDFKTALRNDYLTDTDKRRGGHTALRLRAPFEATAEAETHFSESGTRYSREVDPKPIHVRPHHIIESGEDTNWRWIGEYPTATNTRNALTEEQIEDEGGIDAAVEKAREMWWEELQHELPETFDLGQCVGPYDTKRVEIEWIFEGGA